MDKDNTVLRLDKIYKNFGGLQVLADLDMSMPQDEIVGLIGPNGAGKTTLLKTISGLLHPRKGDILFSGKSLHNLKPQDIVDRGITHVPEGRRLFADLTVFENLRLGTYIPRARPNFDESLKRVYELFPVLKERKSQKAGTLSGGEQQMLAISRAIMAQPKLIMLDEPSLGLSPILVKTIFKFITTLNEEKATILLIEQNINQTLKIAHKAFVLKIGKIVMSGRGEELLANEEIIKAYIGEHKTKKQ